VTAPAMQITSEEAVSGGGCEVLCGAQMAAARAVVVKYGITPETYDREHRTIHGLERDRWLLPESSRAQVAAGTEELRILSAGGDREAILAKAREVEELKARQAASAAELWKLQAEIQKCAVRARDGLARSLQNSFQIVESHLRALFADPGLQQAPQFIDVKAIEGIGKEAEAIIQAFHTLHTNYAAPSFLMMFMAAVPETLWASVSQRIGLRLPRVRGRA
jgi:hypothetical protein